jgi:predicted branched-subunit amino acid permease
MDGWKALWRQDAFRLGMRDMAGPSVGIAAWGLVTGVAMVKSGLSIPVALVMSLMVFAGSAQLAVIPPPARRPGCCGPRRPA